MFPVSRTTPIYCIVSVDTGCIYLVILISPTLVSRRRFVAFRTPNPRHAHDPPSVCGCYRRGRPQFARFLGRDMAFPKRGKAAPGFCGRHTHTHTHTHILCRRIYTHAQRANVETPNLPYLGRLNSGMEQNESKESKRRSTRESRDYT